MCVQCMMAYAAGEGSSSREDRPIDRPVAPKQVVCLCTCTLYSILLRWGTYSTAPSRCILHDNNKEEVSQSPMLDSQCSQPSFGRVGVSVYVHM